MSQAKTDIPGCQLSANLIFPDARGQFRKILNDSTSESLTTDSAIRQVNMSSTNQAGTIRGMHIQIAPRLESKLVTCLSGRIFDVVVDCRPESRTFGQWRSWILDADKFNTLVIPKGCAHGFQTLTDDVTLLYLHTEAYDPMNDKVMNPFSAELGIEWPIECSMISERDKFAPETIPINPAETL